MYKQLATLYCNCHILRKSKQSQNTNSHAWIAQHLTVANLQNLYVVHRLYGPYKNCLNLRNDQLSVSVTMHKYKPIRTNFTVTVKNNFLYEV